MAAAHLQLVTIRTQKKMVAVTVLLKWLLLMNCTSDLKRRLNVSCFKQYFPRRLFPRHTSWWFFVEKNLDLTIALSFQQHKSQKIRTFYGLFGCFSSEI